MVKKTCSRIEEITVPSLASMQNHAQEQEKDEEMKDFFQKSLNLQNFTPPVTKRQIYCDTFTGSIRPFISLRKNIFGTFHNLTHEGSRATTKVISKECIWPGLNKDINLWIRNCVFCQS